MARQTKDQQIAQLTRELAQLKTEHARTDLELRAMRVVDSSRVPSTAEEIDHVRRALALLLYTGKGESDEEALKATWDDLRWTIQTLVADHHDVSKALRDLANVDGANIDAQLEPVQIVEALAEKVPVWINADADLTALNPDWVAWVRDGHCDLEDTSDVAKLHAIAEELLGPQGLRYVLASNDDPIPALRRWVRKVA